MIDDVLLTGQEAINSFCEKAPLSELANLNNDLLIKIGNGLKLVCIAQDRKSQLKLLEWLKAEGKE